MIIFVSKSSKGFTLVEVMIVVAMIGILGSFAFNTYNTYMVRAQQQTGRSFVTELLGELKKYYIENKNYPNSFADLRYANGRIIGGQFLEDPDGYYQAELQNCLDQQTRARCVQVQASPTERGAGRNTLTIIADTNDRWF